MDSATRRVIGEIRDYLNDIQGRTNSPITKTQIENLDQLASDLEHHGVPDDLSPGQMAALGASEAYLGEIEIKPEDSLSPGERAAQEATSI